MTSTIAILSFFFPSIIIFSIKYCNFHIDIDIEGVEHELGFSDIDFSSKFPKERDGDIPDGDEQAAMMRVVSALREARLNAEKPQNVEQISLDSIPNYTNSDSTPVESHPTDPQTNYSLTSDPSIHQQSEALKAIKLTWSRKVLGVMISAMLASALAFPMDRVVGGVGSRWLALLASPGGTQLLWRSLQSQLIYVRALLTKDNLPGLRHALTHLLESVWRGRWRDVLMHGILPITFSAVQLSTATAVQLLLETPSSPFLVRRTHLLVAVLSNWVGCIFSAVTRAVLLYPVWNVATVLTMKDAFVLDATLNVVSFSTFDFLKRLIESLSRKKMKMNLLFDLLLATIGGALAVAVAVRAKLLANLEADMWKYAPHFGVLYSVYEVLTRPLLK
eukprot:CAMPEP_0182426596 /NCGR_PEP_ID=MMETSP1167-20130531/13114_1 /TAXON_ID=2988 /ORGANISM="Mallomonas Sp, Strain CCMP3275" /LENGTH=389 /DNA_ID=CAMNT_0024608159 /DNA_START=230 /DNA_END=1400 /DNA_ORIENTATION=-